MVHHRSIGLAALSLSALLPHLAVGFPLPSPARDPFITQAKIQADRELLHTVTYVGNNKVYGLLSHERPAMREAKLEKEDFSSAILTKLDNVQKGFVDKGNVPAVVDQTSHRQYFGNENKPDGFSRGVVDFFEMLSNIFNVFAEKIPKGAIKSLDKSVLNRLNQIGTVLVGLEDP